MAIETTSHSQAFFADLMAEYETIDTNDPEAVAQFNQTMFQYQQGVSFDAGFAVACHNMVKELLALLKQA